MLGRIREFVRRGLAEPETIEATEAREGAEDRELSLRIRFERMERRANEFFGLIARIEKQRDEWRDMFLNHSAEHQKAQSILQDHIILTRQLIVKALEQLNKYREKNGEPPVVHHTQLLEHPIGTAEEFAKFINSLKDSAPHSINGLAERDRITAETE